MDDEVNSYDLIMPFVVCASRGGPYDDDAFVAGWRLALLDAAAELSSRYTAAQPVVGVVSPSDLPQVELIAMRYGFSLRHQPSTDAPQDWLHVELRRNEGAGSW